MNESIIYVFLGIIAFIAYKKYTHYKVLKQVPSLLEEGAQIVDVRTVDEFLVANKQNSINIPLDLLKDRTSELDKTKPIILCCASGSRSGLAKRVLISKGFENVHNAGAWGALTKFNY